ncbi:hypothetical protein PVAND_011718 [Polypedilum vanderplanki]|uniref:HTH CENPB-type domain-containing protein n=1 Tax=Polypedilum vanderplanki TaxID=319348 RepID=A0A9J6CJH1_POLVA|nr:hypothetical protein PVAND_011718 [Polypedilum vanderplanki]
MCDTTIFAPTKKRWRSEVTNYKRELQKHEIDQVDFIKILSRVMMKTMTPDLIKNGFRGTGIFPLDRSKIHRDRLIGTLPSYTSFSTNVEIISAKENIENIIPMEIDENTTNIIHKPHHSMTFENNDCMMNEPITSSNIYQLSPVITNDPHQLTENEKLLIQQLRNINGQLMESFKIKNSQHYLSSIIINQQLNLIEPTVSISSIHNIQQDSIEIKEPILQAPAVFCRKGVSRRKKQMNGSLSHAIDAVKNEGLTIYSASKRFNIPKNTLKYKLIERNINKRGTKQFISLESERKIVDWIKECARKGDPRTKEELCDAAIQYDKFENHPPRFGENGPSKKWLKSFILRHQDISFRKPEMIGKAAATVCEEDIDYFFSKFEKWMKEEGHEDLLSKPERFFNLDETSFDLNSPPERVLAAKGSKTVYAVNGANLHDNITTTFCFSASGEVLPPQVIFNKSFSRIEDVSYAAGESKTKFLFSQTEKGWQNKDTFFNYIKKLDEELNRRKIERPVVFLFDGHASHTNIDLYLWCKEHQIIVVVFPPNATHILQMCDTTIFAPTKKRWRSEVTNYKRELQKNEIDQVDFIKILSRVMIKTMTPDLIKNGFRGTGIFPLDRSKIHRDRLIGTLPSYTSLSTKIEITSAKENIENIIPMEIDENTTNIIQKPHHSMTFENNDCMMNEPITSSNIHQLSPVITNDPHQLTENEKLLIQQLRNINGQLMESFKIKNSQHYLSSIIINQQLNLIEPTVSISSIHNIQQDSIEIKEPILQAPAVFCRKGVSRRKKQMNGVMTSDEVIEEYLSEKREKERIQKEKDERKVLREQRKLIKENSIKIKIEQNRANECPSADPPKKRGRKPKLVQQNDNRNYPHGRFLPSFPQNSNGFFPPVPVQNSQQQLGSYQQKELFLDGQSTPSFFQPYQPFATTRAPNSFEISPRPFTVTTSPLQSRGQFSNFGQSNARQNNGFQYENPYNFPPSAQQQQPSLLNPYLDSTSFNEPLEYDDQQTYINSQRSRGNTSTQRISNENRNNEKVPSHTTNAKSNKDRFHENLRQRPLITATPEPLTTTTTKTKIKSTKEQNSKKSRYTPITRSTTSKRPQSQSIQPEVEYNDQKYAFSKNNKVKSSLGHDSSVKPLAYQVNITHSEEHKKVNTQILKEFDNTREDVDEGSEENEPEDDDVEYVDYEEDYGVILNEEDRARKEKNYEKTTEITTTFKTTKAPITTSTSKPEENTVIIFDNFILPKQNNNEEKEDEEIEYEYEYIDETEAPEEKTTEKPATKNPDQNFEITTYRDPKRILGEAVVSVVTSKTVVNGSISQQSEEESVQVEETTTEADNYPSPRPMLKATTDNYVVIASVQTSRSISGAHFLPFPHVEQKETKQTRAELINKKNSETITETPAEIKTTTVSDTDDSEEIDNENEELNTTINSNIGEIPTTTVSTTIKNSPLPSTESIIDKLDGIQSDLSLGVLSGEFPVLKDASSKKTKTQDTPLEESTNKEIEITTTIKPLVLIRKFSPKSTTTKRIQSTIFKTTSVTEEIITSTAITPITELVNNTVLESSQRSDKKIAFDAIPQDDLAGLLPPGYKPRTSYKNKKFSSTTTPLSTTDDGKDETAISKPRNATISRSFKSESNAQDIVSTSKFSNKNKDKSSFSKLPIENETDDNSTSKKAFNKLFEKTTDDNVDISKFLPPDFGKQQSGKESLSVIPLENDDLSKFLPPGFKIDSTTSISSTDKPKVQFVEDDISKFLPPGYKPPVPQTNIEPRGEAEEKVTDFSNILNKIKFSDAANLLPPGFKENISSIPAVTVEEKQTTEKSNNKLVFPTRAGKKPARFTTPKANHGEGPKPPEIEIRKGPPTRATTEFTGWPSKATTPFSLEKFLEVNHNAMHINIADILSTSTTAQTTTTITTTSTTTTSTTTTPRPREAIVCKTDCSLAATIRIIDGIEWSPELLTHHTEEYKNLAAELESDLNEVYSKSEKLNKWFKSVKIDSFSKGSVLVDYFIELKELPNEMNTTEIKKLFHESLETVPIKINNTSNDNETLPQPITKEVFKLGNFVVDPVSTDFIVIQKLVTPPSEDDDENVLLPQWAIAMITIGLLSLVFVILLGIAVLIIRKKAAKKKAPTPLTADMLNELNKNHMGGFENYGAEDAYNLEDTWDERRNEIKPKRLTSAQGNQPNIYDSWRSQHIQRYQADELFYDSHDPFNEFKPPKQYQSHHLPYSNNISTNRFMEPNWNDGWNDHHSPYHHGSHNQNSRKYYRDYDQHF